MADSETTQGLGRNRLALLGAAVVGVAAAALWAVQGAEGPMLLARIGSFIRLAGVALVVAEGFIPRAPAGPPAPDVQGVVSLGIDRRRFALPVVGLLALAAGEAMGLVARLSPLVLELRGPMPALQWAWYAAAFVLYLLPAAGLGWLMLDRRPLIRLGPDGVFDRFSMTAPVPWSGIDRAEVHKKTVLIRGPGLAARTSRAYAFTPPDGLRILALPLTALDAPALAEACRRMKAGRTGKG